jgi:integrase
MGYKPVPISDINICRYAAYLTDVKKLSAASIPKYLNIIRLLHLECGLANPLEDNWALDSVLRGIKRILGETPKRKLPLSPDILVRIKDLLNFDSPVHVVFWAACMVMFFGLFRKSNVLAPGGVFDPQKNLCRSDFFLHHWGLEIRVRWSKTIQNKERSLSVPIPYIMGHSLCPASAVIKAFNLTRSAPRDGPAFVYPVMQGVEPLRYPRFLKLLRHYLGRLGLASGQYAGHSFRRGGATLALQAGIPGDIIMQLGDWKSDAYRLYLDVPLEFKASCIARVAKALP